MVARIELGRQSPSLTTLERLVRACGLELRVEAAGGVPRARQAAGSSGRLLVWRSGEGVYAFPLEAVERIAELGRLERLPGQPAGAGVVTVDGEAITAVASGHRLGVEGVSPAQIVVVSVDNGRRAVLVDRAETVAHETAILPPPAGSGAAAFVAGLAEVDGRQVAVLDPAGFCG